MGIQELIAFLVVGVAVLYAGRAFVRQFTHGESTCAECGKCQPAAPPNGEGIIKS